MQVLGALWVGVRAGGGLPGLTSWLCSPHAPCLQTPGPPLGHGSTECTSVTFPHTHACTRMLMRAGHDRGMSQTVITRPHSRPWPGARQPRSPAVTHTDGCELTARVASQYKSRITVLCV